MIKIGDFNTFKVLRQSDLGYMLECDGEEVLLHFNQATEEVTIDQNIEAFVYIDSEQRIAATLDFPFATVNNHAFLKVVNVSKDGVFLDNNLPKDVFLSKDYLSVNKEQWPSLDDQVLVKLQLKQNRLNAKLLNKAEIHSLYTEKTKYSVKEVVSATIVRATPNAYNALTEDFTYIFVPIKQARQTFRLGEKVKATIISERDDEYIASLNPFKEELIDVDCELILKYLEEHDSLPLTAKSQSDEIEKYFNMSRKAFKRALGHLYKEKKVYFDEINTYLNDEL